MQTEPAQFEGVLVSGMSKQRMTAEADCQVMTGCTMHIRLGSGSQCMLQKVASNLPAGIDRKRMALMCHGSHGPASRLPEAAMCLQASHMKHLQSIDLPF